MLLLQHVHVQLAQLGPAFCGHAQVVTLSKLSEKLTKQHQIR